MKTVRVLLEGDKDVYFMHEFILQRFPSFLRENNPIPHRLQKVPVEMIGGGGQSCVKVILYKMGGFKNVACHAELFLPKADTNILRLSMRALGRMEVLMPHSQTSHFGIGMLTL